MGNIFGRAEIERLQAELESTQQALEQQRQRAAAELEAEQRQRAAAESELGACDAAASSLRTELAAVRQEEEQAREAAAAARKAHDEHALLVKRILTAQQEYGVRASLAGVPSPAAAAERIAREPSQGALSRVDASAWALEAPAVLARMLADRERDEERAALLGAGIGAEAAGIGDLSLELRGAATSAVLGLTVRGAAGGGLSSSPFDAAVLGGGIMHRLSFGALGASAVYDPVAKSIDEARVSMLLLPPPADGSARPSARLLASMDHTGELALAHSWRPTRALTLKTNLGIDVNKSSCARARAHTHPECTAARAACAQRRAHAPSARRVAPARRISKYGAHVTVDMR